jgi:hypothetical protein
MTMDARGLGTSYVCSYCHTGSEGGVSCQECGAPLNQAGSLLVSDADRDQIIAELTDHFQAGRLTMEEFDDRSGQALRARTQAELLGVLANLPAPPVGGRGGGFAGEVFPDGTGFPARKSRIGIVVLIVVVALVIGGAHGGHGSLSGLIPVAVIAFFIFRRRGRRRGYGDDPGWNERELRRDERDFRDLRRDERRLRRDDRRGGGGWS